MVVRRGTLLFTSLLLILALEYCRTCSQVFTTQSGYIQSPKDADQKYPNNANCTYTIRVGYNVHYIHFKFEQFGLENIHDKLQVGGQIFTGSMPKYTNTYNVDKTFVLHFTTDHSVNSAGGFRIRYRVIPDANVKIFRGRTGMIENPKALNSIYYPDNAIYLTVIKSFVGDNGSIQIIFEKFYLEQNCDFLYVGHRAFTGSQSGTQVNDVFNDDIKLVFTTDGSRHTYAGFRINYRIIPNCIDGMYGLPCTQRCHIGCSDVCHKVTGMCNCKVGWTGAKCDAACPSGTYDSYCSKSCSPGCVNGSCSRVGGSCSCRPGYTGSSCTRQCSDGFYGLNCASRCRSGCLGVCNKETGTCACRSGWTGAHCETECPSGTYDSYCSKTCSPGCVDGSCNKEDGSCSCRPGYTGRWCKHECSDGYYGVNCTSHCSSGCLDACNKESGTCTCKAGWTGKQCHAACPSGTYDSYCTKSCSSGCVDGSCTKQNGSCPEKQPDSRTEHGELNMKVIVSVTGGLVGFITLLAAGLVICYCNRRKRSRNKDTKIPTTWKEITLRAASNETATSGEEALYDLPIEGEAARKTERYETLRYSGDQRLGTSQSVLHVTGDVENETEYVNLPIQKKNVKIERNKSKQCYENHAIHSTDSEM